MKVLFVVATLLAISLAEDMKTAETYPVASYHTGPSVASNYHTSPAVSQHSAGHAYGAHGTHSAGHNAYGRSHYGDHGVNADRAHAAHGHHDIGAVRAHDASGAHAAQYGRYRNVGAYAQDKGAGYEKAYAYDKKAGHHTITDDHAARSAEFGVRDRGAFHSLGAHASRGHDRYGAHNRYGANAYGSQAHDNSEYGRYGRGHEQSYQAAPAVSGSYHAAPPVAHHPAPVHSAPVHHAPAHPAPIHHAPAAHHGHSSGHGYY